MKPRWLTALLGLIVLLGLVLGVSAVAVSAAGAIGPVVLEEAFGARREVQTAAEILEPEISVIDSPSAVCYKPDSSRDTCYITWSYLYVSASVSQYMISMTVSIDNHLRAYHAGFFQTTMYVPGELFGRGFKVNCGLRNAVGMGNTYAYTLRARDTAGTTAANFGSVQCPGVYLDYLPIVRR